MYSRAYVAFIVGLMIFPVMYFGVNSVFAQSELEKLQDQISDRTNRLDEIQKEIAKYESALKEVGAEKNTLQSAINKLELERKKIQADIKFTENKIESTDLTIDKISYEIKETEKSIDTNEDTIKHVLRQMNISNNESLIEILLQHDNIAEFWDEFEALETVRVSIGEKINELSDLKTALENNRSLNTRQKEQLLNLKSQYDDQQTILSNNKAEKAELLSATKNEEANYQQLLKDKQAARDRLMAEVRDIESQIKFILDPNTIPAKGTAVFIWPLDNPIITQRFGYTQFALSGAYNGSQHNGMDLGAPIGTKIYAPLTGTVRMTGNTDSVPGCYSWGKWVLIDHPNGLSSMFAHLSQIAVSAGQKVSTGDVVGYVGNTGYSTGPHLHYTLYVTKGVQVMQFNQFKSVTGCGAALSPFAGIDAYLDPLDYLPKI
ncbi:peptidoglycan DD-metalloendopeptidase family protein [Candidatus Kaiserbacteria bacterium]|nr:peptidoglycan DD-metalloendopeptidase family protein [Candidatus Kaiserbacteria bacterium]